MPNRDAFPAIFAELRTHSQALTPGFPIEQETPESLYLRVPPSAGYPKGRWFGGVESSKSYVSYHLLPVYVYPALLDGVSDRLRKRMHGKSCFNFRTADTALFAELAQFTQASALRFQQETGE